ncbi:response regulator [Psychrobacillus lasiicapitis]|uniref:Response regulator n=1 Tax=Psychrobacillus lasiicapitis TaxID=1636719 RepID=A0A544SU40_9BACI|nr:response regulator [Psychrobacillus lasiicapitis]TQR08665.1 response regulator [Psychrobacillus lasiicapitis]
MRYFIVDDDLASRKMLKEIITEGDIGLVIGEANSGISSLSPITTMQPDVVLIDFLMPELDGIETIEQLRKKGYQGQFIMISQIINKEMVGEAYEKGVEFFIHKPINRIEVLTILRKTAEQIRLQDSLLAIKESLANIVPIKTVYKKQSVKEIVHSILSDMGILGEVGIDDIVAMIEFLFDQKDSMIQLPPLKELYEAVATKSGISFTHLQKESKAIEQRLRRTILNAMNNIASLGAIDYTNADFEYYAPRYFDFQEIRSQMIHMQEGRKNFAKMKVNIKKFLQVLYMEVQEKYNEIQTKR